MLKSIIRYFKNKNKNISLDSFKVAPKPTLNVSVRQSLSRKIRCFISKLNQLEIIKKSQKYHTNHLYFHSLLKRIIKVNLIIQRNLLSQGPQ